MEHYLEKIGNPAHRVSLIKLRLGTHLLRIQTGKYENRGTAIPVQRRTCLVCKTNVIELGWAAFLDVLPEIPWLHSTNNRVENCFETLNDQDKIKYILEAEIQEIIGKYIYLKRKEILSSYCNQITNWRPFFTVTVTHSFIHSVDRSINKLLWSLLSA